MPYNLTLLTTFFVLFLCARAVMILSRTKYMYPAIPAIPNTCTLYYTAHLTIIDHTVVISVTVTLFRDKDAYTIRQQKYQSSYNSS